MIQLILSLHAKGQLESLQTDCFCINYQYCSSGLLIASSGSARYCSGATFRVAIAVAALLFAKSSDFGSAATFSVIFGRYSLPLLLAT